MFLGSVLRKYYSELLIRPFPLSPLPASLLTTFVAGMEPSCSSKYTLLVTNDTFPWF